MPSRWLNRRGDQTEVAVAEKVKVLFVCLGNICRSPTAHGVFAGLVKSQGLEKQILVNSAGTSGWHIGQRPDARSVAAARERGIDLSRLRGSQVKLKDFQVYDYILAMDKKNLADLKALAPDDFDGCLDLLLNFDPLAGLNEVPDPYYGARDGFERVIAMIESASSALLEHIQTRDLGYDQSQGSR